METAAWVAYRDGATLVLGDLGPQFTRAASRFHAERTRSRRSQVTS